MGPLVCALPVSISLKLSYVWESQKKNAWSELLGLVSANRALLNIKPQHLSITNGTLIRSRHS